MASVRLTLVTVDRETRAKTRERISNQIVLDAGHEPPITIDRE